MKDQQITELLKLLRDCQRQALLISYGTIGADKKGFQIFQSAFAQACECIGNLARERSQRKTEARP